MSDKPLREMASNQYYRHDLYKSVNDPSYGLDRPERTPPRSRKPPRQGEQIQRVAGLTVGFCSILSQEVLSHPFMVLRRQCQVHCGAGRSHLTPFTVIPVLVNLHTHQPAKAMWKGFSSVLMTRGILMVSETAISEFTPLPREIAAHRSLKKIVQHLGLKSLAFTVTTPFYVSTFLETVQSRIASDSPGMFDCVKEGVQRLVGRGIPQSPRLLSIWYLLLPTASFKLCQYIIQSLSHYTVTTAIRREQQEVQEQSTSVDGQAATRSIYDEYFPELVAAFTGNLMADLMLYPFETVLHRLYVQGTRALIDNTDTGVEVIPITTHYEGVVDCFKTIMMEEGVSGLYQGYGALILQYMVHAVILRTGIFLFEKISRELQTPENGSSISPQPPRK